MVTISKLLIMENLETKSPRKTTKALYYVTWSEISNNKTPFIAHKPARFQCHWVQCCLIATLNSKENLNLNDSRRLSVLKEFENAVIATHVCVPFIPYYNIKAFEILKKKKTYFSRAITWSRLTEESLICGQVHYWDATNYSKLSKIMFIFWHLLPALQNKWMAAVF